MKIAIVGSRTFNDYPLLEKVISDNIKIEDIDLVISGGAKGADRLGERFATINKIEKQIFYPDWNRYGKQAGFLRNIKIVRNADLIFAFWDGQSKGTEHTINLCQEHGKKCIIQRFKGEYMNKVVMIDGNNLAHICFHSAQNIVNKNNPTEGRESFLEGMTYHLFFNKLISFFKQFQGHYFITWDMKNSISWRKEIYPEYKSNREMKSDYEVLFQAMSNLRKIISFLPIYQFTKEGYEADDILFWAAANAHKFGSEMIIISNDSDLLQIVQRFPTAKQFDPKKNVFMSAPTTYNVAVFKALAGDITDNIPGIKGVGKITAQKWAEQVFGMNDLQLFKTISSLLKNKEDKIKQFKQFYSIVNIENNPNLINLDINFDSLYNKKHFDVVVFKAFLEKYKLQSHLNNLDKTEKLFNSLYE